MDGHMCVPGHMQMAFERKLLESPAGARLVGSIPQVFDSLIDLQVIILNDNPGLVSLFVHTSPPP